MTDAALPDAAVGGTSWHGQATRRPAGSGRKRARRANLLTYTVLIVVAAIILVPLQTATNTWFGGGGSGLTYILYGGIILLLARFEPGGMHELWYRISPRLARRPHAA